MAINKLPPPPRGMVELDRNVALYLQELERLLNSTDQIEWDRIDFTNSDLADIATRLHNDLQSIQGGTTNERYHMTAAEHAVAIDPKLSDLTIDTDKDWQGYDITNLEDVGVDGTATIGEIVCTGEEPITYNDTMWDDMRIGATTVRVPGSKQPTWSSFLTDLQVLVFSDQAVGANEEEIYFETQFSHRYKLGTNIKPHVHWCPDDATAGTVRWGMIYSWANINDVFPSTTTIYADDATSSTQDQHLIAGFSDIDWSTNDGVSAVLIGKLFRNSSHANDTYTGGAQLLSLDFHYEIDTPGSKLPTSK
jgi:hypothetical protein